MYFVKTVLPERHHRQDGRRRRKSNRRHATAAGPSKTCIISSAVWPSPRNRPAGPMATTTKSRSWTTSHWTTNSTSTVGPSRLAICSPRPCGLRATSPSRRSVRTPQRHRRRRHRGRARRPPRSRYGTFKFLRQAGRPMPFGPTTFRPSPIARCHSMLIVGYDRRDARQSVFHRQEQLGPDESSRREWLSRTSPTTI